LENLVKEGFAAVMSIGLRRTGLLLMIGKLVAVAASVVAASVLVARWADHNAPLAPAPSALAAQRAQPAANVDNSRSVLLKPDKDGHFHTEARVDGYRLEMVVDTGASMIALRAVEAARLGIHPTARDYNVKVSTANGVSRAALVQLGRVEIGDIVVRDVAALVHPDEALGVNLLGMSFLSRVRWTHDRGKLLIEQ
jgi:aspartyl protease family protein